MQGSKRFSRHRRGLLFPHLHLQVSYDLLTKVWQLAHAFIFNIILYGPNRTRYYMQLFYIEDVFNLVEMQNRSIGIQFNPLSNSYRKYPFGITLKTISNQDLKTIMDNIKNNRFSSGLILGNGYNNDPKVSDEIAIAFNTTDIIEIEYV